MNGDKSESRQEHPAEGGWATRAWFVHEFRMFLNKMDKRRIPAKSQLHPAEAAGPHGHGSSTSWDFLKKTGAATGVAKELFLPQMKLKKLS